jgi:hypothetical protein
MYLTDLAPAAGNHPTLAGMSDRKRNPYWTMVYEAYYRLSPRKSQGAGGGREKAFHLQRNDNMGDLKNK